MSTRLVSPLGSLIVPTVTIAYIDTYWHKGYTKKYLSIGKNIITSKPIKTFLDEIHKPIESSDDNV